MFGALQCAVMENSSCSELLAYGHGANKSVHTSCLAALIKPTFMTRDVLRLSAPNLCNWNADVLESDGWKAALHTSTIIFGILFLLLACVSLFLLFKRREIDRFQLKTTVVVYLALAVLGVSRFFFNILISVIMAGSCKGNLLECKVPLRLMDALGFPSLTASYTVVFLTLVLAAKIRIGPEVLQKPKVIIPLSLIHYVVAVIFEVVGLTASGAALVALISCEAFYAAWGILVCLLFLCVGIKLIKEIRHSIKTTSLIVKRKQHGSRFSIGRKSGTRARGSVKMIREVRSHHRRALRKVTLVTYFVAVLGILYSGINVARLIYNILILTRSCAYFRGEITSDHVREDPINWLVLFDVARLMEILLSCLLLYCVTDIAPYVQAFKKAFCKRGKLKVAESTETALGAEEDKNKKDVENGRYYKKEEDTNVHFTTTIRIGESETADGDNSVEIVCSQEPEASEGTPEPPVAIFIHPESPPMLEVEDNSLNEQESSQSNESDLPSSQDTISMLKPALSVEPTHSSPRKISCPAVLQLQDNNYIPQTDDDPPRRSSSRLSGLFSLRSKSSDNSQRKRNSISTSTTRTSETEHLSLSKDRYAVIGVSWSDLRKTEEH